MSERTHIDWKNAARRIAKPLASLYRALAPVVLCILGGTLWIAGVKTGHPAIGFGLACGLYAYALDIAVTHARARGQSEGVAASVAIIQAADGLDISISHGAAVGHRPRTGGKA